jgi:acetyltransferase
VDKNETAPGPTGQSAADMVGRRARLSDGREVVIRPLEADDARLYAEFDRGLTSEDRRLRFFASLREIGRDRIKALTQFDRREGAAYAALDARDGSLLGVARVHRERDGEAEFAVLVRSDVKGRGLGRRLMGAAVEGARRLGFRRIAGLILRDNARMIGFCRKLGFKIAGLAEDPGLVRAGMSLEPAPKA